MNQDSRGRGAAWVVGQAALLAAVLFSGVSWTGSWESLTATITGVVLLVSGAVCGIAGAASLGRNLTPFPRPGSRARLVQSGIYALIRHPLYTAVFCASAGWALVRGSASAMLVVVVLGAFFDAKARREERWLRELFPEYARYQERVRRFIPWIY